MKLPTRDEIYQRFQTCHSRWLQRRHEADFSGVERFCLFVGYPRSGHSLVGACLNAHPDAVISSELPAPLWIMRGCSREELYGRILARAIWFDFFGNRSNYRYQVPNKWQGRFRRLKVIGDKRGGWVTRTLAETPDFFDRVRDLVGVPCRFVHVVRNPFDNIAAISIAGKTSLEAGVNTYFRHVDVTRRLGAFCRDGELLTIHHEQMIADPGQELTALCEHLGLDPAPDYLKACAKIVFPAPTNTRQKVVWTAAERAKVAARIEEVPFLRDYQFDEPAPVP